ncbi:hypothetical protein, partial [Paraburkholderia sp. C35]|uniref:hypothetical protein n=1 Tax=Paraburkholderia sp. C35 TaxID=2126993 RepID=UPI00194FCC2E
VSPLSFAYFSLRRQRKVGAAPHRGDASSGKSNRGCQRKRKQKQQQNQNHQRRRKTKTPPATPCRIKP